MAKTKNTPGRKFAKVLVFKNGSMRSMTGKKVSKKVIDLRTSPKTKFFHER